MPRHPRIHSSEVLYHIISRGNNRQQIFKEDSDFEKFVSLLKEGKEKYKFTIYSYVLMNNHFHLLVSVGDWNTSRIMQSVLTGYTKYFNRKYKKVGHLFQGRYKAVVCDRDIYALELVRYIHLNPLRAKMVDSLDKWRWSGHDEVLKGERVINRSMILSQFGNGESGFRKYLAFMNDGLETRQVKEYYPKESKPFLGDDSFELRVNHEEPNVRAKKKSLDVLAKEESKIHCISFDVLKSKVRIGPAAKARAAFIRKAVLVFGYSQVEVAKFLCCDQAYVSRIVVSHVSQV